MNSFYSILYCPIRDVADERISIALLLVQDKKVYFQYSHDKLKIIRDLLPDPAYKLLKANLTNFENYFIERQSFIADQNNNLINIPIKNPDFLEPSYINYLNSYSQNLIKFSKPSHLSVDADQNIFNILFDKFVFKTDQEIQHEFNIYQQIKSKYNPLLRRRVNLDIELTSNEIRNLVVPTKVWFIGQNDVEVTGEIFDFDRQTHHLSNDITKHLNLVHTIKEKANNSVHFIVGKEPPKKNQKNHSIWNNLRSLKYLRYIPQKEASQIKEYVIEHDVKPFLKSESEEDFTNINP